MMQRISSSAIKVFFLLTGLFCLWPTFEVSPCTLFGAVGNSVEAGEIRGPTYYLVGNIHKITLLEVIDSHRHEFLVRQNGVLYHTNHFTLNAMERFNRKIGASSQARLNRIESLLKESLFTKEKFIAFAQDHSNGPGNNLICRHFESGVRGSGREGRVNNT
jgi:hypothetical protein